MNNISLTGYIFNRGYFHRRERRNEGWAFYLPLITKLLFSENRGERERRGRRVLAISFIG
jgi:hypothetical protein